jgi:hypothetical protein
LCAAGLSAVIIDAAQINTRHAQPQRNLALTGQLVTRAHGAPPAQPESSAKHYHAKTVYRTNWFFILLYTLSVLASLTYFIVRIVYISTGSMRPKIPANQGLLWCPERSPGCNLTRDGLTGTVMQLLDATDNKVEINSKIGQDVLDQPEFADLNSVRTKVAFLAESTCDLACGTLCARAPQL